MFIGIASCEVVSVPEGACNSLTDEQKLGWSGWHSAENINNFPVWLWLSRRQWDSTYIETVLYCICTQDSSPFGNVCDCPICMAQGKRCTSPASDSPPWHDNHSYPGHSPGNRLIAAAELFWKSRLKLPKQICNHQGLDLQLHGFLLSSLVSLRGFPLISVRSVEEVLAKAKHKEVLTWYHPTIDI